ncbi:xanthine dehydrogenase subunit B [Paenibacillus curdlanolyticus YK9]|uniref:Xanthine dehydrogenase subunit B n=1 Tax=Paenibacillus curdlanolyticus YK9 TaxID=717606 RepID=E0IDQ8_9BACL|nr:nucleotidyltransferase family protein [Paenibacillus curdlanolyticus]EFM09262.1 xanthine dehydrogenase subunit B [Paenibacillus curdlanolyticus YK9]
MTTIVGLLLAAGASSRMGQSKLALEWPGTSETVGARCLRLLQSAVSVSLVVVRPEQPLSWMRPSLAPAGLDKERLRILPCANAAEGLSASLRMGVSAAGAMGADAVLVMLADQPFVTEEVLASLVRRYGDGSELDWVAATDGEGPKPPIVLSKRLFEQVETLRGDEGARRIVRQQSSLRGELVLVDEACFFDIDTPEQWAEAKRRYIS